MAKKKGGGKKPAAKPRQSYLPGLKPHKDMAIHAAAEKYKEAMEATGNARKREKDFKAALVEKMRAKKLDVYRYGNVSVSLSTNDIVKVRDVDENEEVDEGVPEAAPYPAAELNPDNLNDNLEAKEAK